MNPQSNESRGVVSTENRIQTVALLVLATIALGFVLYWFKGVLIPFVLAALLAIGLEPLAEWQMRRLRLPRALAILSTLFVSLVLLWLVVQVVTASVTQLAANAGLYQARFSEMLAWAREHLPSERFGIKGTDDLSSLIDLPEGSISGFLLGTTNALLDLVSQAMLVMVFLVYLLAGWTGRTAGGVWAAAEARVRRFIVAKTLISAVTGVLVGSVLAILGVELAVVFGLFAFLLNFIPTVGSIVATLLPLPIVLVNPEVGPTAAVLAIVIPGTIQFVIGNVVEPPLIGGTVDLNPITALLALVIWGTLWGVVGMLLATPLTAVLRILAERLEPTRPLGELLGGRGGQT